MRQSMTNYIFKEHNNMITHTAASKLLHENPMMRAWAAMICEESWPAAARVRQLCDSSYRVSTNLSGRPLMPWNVGQDPKSRSTR